MFANIVPTNNHVLCGRGKVNANHPGNQKFASIVRANLEEYNQAQTRIEKAIVVASIVTYIRKECGLEFIKYNQSTKQYEELPSQKIHGKVSHAIRDEMRKNEKAMMRATTLKKAMKRPFKMITEESNTTRLSKNIPTMCFSSTIFDLGEKVEDIFSTPSPLDEFPFQSESMPVKPANVTRVVSLHGEDEDLCPLPLDDSSFLGEMELGYQDIQKVCSILEQQ